MALTKTEVSQLYVAIFNRAGEGEGNEYWQNRGLSASQTVTEMLNTTDSMEYFGSALDNNQAFIEHIYLNTLNKTYSDDKDGIDFWVSALENNTRGYIVTELINAINNPQNTGVAQDQFDNRVEVSDYTADNLYSVPTDYKTALGFDEELVVTDDESSITLSKSVVDAKIEQEYSEIDSDIESDSVEKTASEIGNETEPDDVRETESDESDDDDESEAESDDDDDSDDEDDNDDNDSDETESYSIEELLNSRTPYSETNTYSIDFEEVSDSTSLYDYDATIDIETDGDIILDISVSMDIFIA